MTTTASLTARLLAAIEEAEQLARDAINPTDVPCQITVNGQPQPTTHGDRVIYGDGATALRNLVAQDPRGVIRHCVAERRIVERHEVHGDEYRKCTSCGERWPCPDLRDIAAAYDITTEETT